MEPNLNRLRKLLRTLETVPAGSFNLRNWCKTDECGTTACAVGHYCFDHPEEQMRMHLEPDQLDGGLAYPIFVGRIGLGACEIHFGLTDIQVERLFYACMYPREHRRNPLAVAARLREMFPQLAEVEPEPVESELVCV